MQNRRKLPEVRSVRKEVAENLSCDGNRLLLMEAILVLMTVTVLYLTLSNCYWIGLLPLAVRLGWDTVWIVPTIYGAAVCLLTILFTLPLVIGLLGLSRSVESGEEVALPELFRPFSSFSRYLRAVRLSFGFFWRIGLAVFAVSLTYGLTDRFGGGRLWAALLCAFAIVLEITAAFLLLARRFAVLFFALSGQNPPLRVSRRQAKRFPYSAGLRFFLTFLPWILLSLLTFGILLLADTLPRMCVAYFRYCRKIADLPDDIDCNSERNDYT